MAVSSKDDLAKKKKELEKNLKKLADPVTGQQKIPAMITMIRGNIRESWSMSPVKLAYHEMGRTMDLDKTPRKWKWQCEYCNNWLGETELEYDHTTGNHTFTMPEDFVSYFDNIINVQFKDIRRICKFKCHKVKSHLEKDSNKCTTMSEAACDKINIFLIKFTENLAYSDWLRDNGISPEASAPKRRVQGMSFWTRLEIPEEDLLDFFESCDYLMRLEAKKKKAKRFKLTAKDNTKLQYFVSFWGKYGIVEPVCKFTLV